MTINQVLINPVNIAIFYRLKSEEIRDIFSSYKVKGVLRISASKDVPANTIRLMCDGKLVEDIELEVLNEAGVKLPTSH